MVLSPPVYVKLSLVLLFGFFLILLAIQISRFTGDLSSHFFAVDALVRNVNKFTSGGALAHSRWQKQIDSREYSIHDVQITVRYCDDMGHRVTIEKTQKLIAHRDGVKQIWDRELKATGSFDWDSIETSPGKIVIGSKRPVGTRFEVPTEFSNPLPLEKYFMRRMKVDVIDSFKEETEDFVFSATKTTIAASITVIGTDNMEFTDITGKLTFGNYESVPDQQPRLMDRKTIQWDISNPQVGEVYQLIWTRRV